MRRFMKYLLFLTLPGQEDTRSDLDYYVHEHTRDHFQFTAGGSIDAGDFVVVGGVFCGVADRDADSGDLCTLHCAEGILIRTAEVRAGADFDTIGQEVWFDDVTKEVDDHEDDGHYLIGYLVETVDADGVIGFEKLRYCVAGVGT